MVKGLRPAVQSELRGAVHTHIEGGNFSRARGDVDDVAALPRDHRWENGVGAICRAQEIDSDYFFDCFKLALDERFAHADAGVINQDVYLAVIGEDLGDHATHLFGIAHVATDHGRCRTITADFFQCFPEPQNGSTTTDHDGAARRKINGELLADAAGRAGNEDDLVFEIHGYF